jgi:ribonuclease HI
VDPVGGAEFVYGEVDAPRSGEHPAGVTDDEAEAAAVVELERLLLRPDVRADRRQVEVLLHQDFQEIGASGRVWDRETIVNALVGDPAAPGAAEAFEPAWLAENVVLLTYRVNGEAGSLRSSLWVRDSVSGWQLRFHQGTRMPA